VILTPEISPVNQRNPLHFVTLGPRIRLDQPEFYLVA
jgi:hypothetical protein